MGPEKILFDAIDPAAEAATDARAEADMREGRLIGHAVAKPWIAFWGSDRPLRPTAGD
jgi:hypothetical protein